MLVLPLIVISSFDALVSADLSACVSEWNPQMPVRVVPSLDDAATALADAPALFALLVKGAADLIEAAGLPELVARKGGALIWMSDIAADGMVDAAHDWARIDMPFSAEQVRAALAAAAPVGGRPLFSSP